MRYTYFLIHMYILEALNNNILEPDTYLMFADGDQIIDAPIEPDVKAPNPLKETLPPIENLQLFDIDINLRRIYVVSESPHGVNISWFAMNRPDKRRYLLCIFQLKFER